MTIVLVNELEKTCFSDTAYGAGEMYGGVPRHHSDEREHMYYLLYTTISADGKANDDFTIASEPILVRDRDGWWT